MTAMPSPHENHNILPLGTRESRLRDAESIRQDYVRKTGPIPKRPLRAPGSGEDEAEQVTGDE
jgi:hypothetical protein